MYSTAKQRITVRYDHSHLRLLIHSEITSVSTKCGSDINLSYANWILIKFDTILCRFFIQWEFNGQCHNHILYRYSQQTCLLCRSWRHTMIYCINHTLRSYGRNDTVVLWYIIALQGHRANYRINTDPQLSTTPVRAAKYHSWSPLKEQDSLVQHFTLHRGKHYQMQMIQQTNLFTSSNNNESIVINRLLATKLILNSMALWICANNAVLLVNTPNIAAYSVDETL